MNMLPSIPDDDDELLAELKEALDEGVNQDETMAMLMGGYDLVNSETVPLDLTFDSATPGSLVGVRDGEPGAARLLSFESADLSTDLELDGARLSGHVEADDIVEAMVDQRSLAHPLRLGEAGSFQATVDPAAGFRLRFIDGSGRSHATGWVEPPGRDDPDATPGPGSGLAEPGGSDGIGRP